MFPLIALTLALSPVQQAAPHAMPGEEAVAPYTTSPANAGARSFSGDAMARAFGGRDGIARIVKRMIAISVDDPEISEIFKGQDLVRLDRTINEQFCQILNAGCTYTGRDMKSSHAELGIQQADMNRLVENLQAAMKAEGVSFAAQNRFLAKLAPMRRDVVTR